MHARTIAHVSQPFSPENFQLKITSCIVSRLQQVDQDMSATYSSISGCLKFVNAISKRLKWENLMTIWFNWMLTFWIQLTMIQSSLVNSFIHLSIWTFTKRYYWNFKSQVSELPSLFSNASWIAIMDMATSILTGKVLTDTHPLLQTYKDPVVTQAKS